jgi:hypothetical protein
VEAIDDARYEVHDLTRWLDNPVRRFINDVAIPITMIMAILTGDIIAPEVAPATAPVLVANCARLAPYVGRLAAAIGVEEIYRRVTTFFSEKAREGNKDSGSSKERIQNSPQDIKEFLSNKLQKGICEKWKPIKGRQTYRFTRKEGKFKKDDWISHDTLHHELEWFNSKGIHKGAIDPKSGTKYKPADLRKNIKMN